jgi:hypothetical protein
MRFMFLRRAGIGRIGEMGCAKLRPDAGDGGRAFVFAHLTGQPANSSHAQMLENGQCAARCGRRPPMTETSPMFGPAGKAKK